MIEPGMALKRSLATGRMAEMSYRELDFIAEFLALHFPELKTPDEEMSGADTVDMLCRIWFSLGKLGADLPE